MKKYTHIAFLILGALLVSIPTFSAKPKGPIVWSQKPNSRTGLYTTDSYFIKNGISLTLSAMYYFGDVDNEGVAFHGGFNKNNMSYGGGFTFQYHLPVGHHTNMRFSLMGGTLRGNNTVKFQQLNPPRDDYRKFESLLIQPSVGVECYPFSNAGFYLYAGVALSASIITNYEFYYYARVGGGEKERQLVQGSTYGLLPMVQLGLGYSFALTDSWSLSIELMGQEGLVDTHYMNLDAYPLKDTQNNKGVALGSTSGKWVDKDGNEHIHWNDGWFQLGITITYRWRNCEHCRLYHP